MKKIIIITTFLCVFLFTTVCFAASATPKVVTKIQKALESISSWIVKLLHLPLP